ncbi:MAG: hypothetical protein ACLFVO_23400 [Chloroflexaceae bacterium]
MTDLWPDDIAVTTARSPVSILREQAAILGKKIRNLVEATVMAQDVGDPTTKKPGIFTYSFYLVAPALHNYHYRLFSITHDIELYPVTFLLDCEVANQILNTETAESWVQVKAESEEDLIRVLKSIFNANKTRQVIQAMLAQTTSFTNDDTAVSMPETAAAA